VAVESDHACVDELYRHCKQKKISNITTILSDIAQPTPGVGWNNAEHTSLFNRLNCDVVMALALLHHLCISKNVPLAFTAQLLAGITENMQSLNLYRGPMLKFNKCWLTGRIYLMIIQKQILSVLSRSIFNWSNRTSVFFLIEKYFYGEEKDRDHQPIHCSVFIWIVFCCLPVLEIFLFV
jgi:hypothetical protein